MSKAHLTLVSISKQQNQLSLAHLLSFIIPLSVDQLSDINFLGFVWQFMFCAIKDGFVMERGELLVLVLVSGFCFGFGF